jgi:undecaprenyl diphosphate synthase
MNDCDSSTIPAHVAIIMDGNGRWAQKRRLNRALGHRQGAKAVEKIIKAAVSNKVSTLSLFAFSTENWGRPSEEVRQLWDLLAQSIDDNLEKIAAQNIKIKFIGDFSALSDQLVQKVDNAMSKTAHNNALNLVIAINYSGRQDIIQAAAQICNLGLDKSEQAFADNLMTSEFGDVDLLIRTGGEKRISNFMLWQCAYSELYFTDIKWPDFAEHDFAAALEYYAGCNRRFGLVHMESHNA